MGGTAAAASVAVTKGKELYDYNKERRKAKKNLIGLKTQKNYEINAAKNLLERNLAEKKAKISSMGLINSSSASAAKKRLKTEGLMNISRINHDYAQKENAIVDNFRDKRDEFVYNSLLNSSNNGQSQPGMLSLLSKVGG